MREGKTLKTQITILLFIAALFVTAGCSGRYERSDYYERPSWTRNGEIICIRGILEKNFDTINNLVGESYNEYLSVVTADGTGETVYNQVTDYLAENLTYNPTTEMVAFRTGSSAGVSRYIVMQFLPSASYTGPDQLTLSVPNVLSFDWDNTGTKLVYCNTDGEIRTINLDGSGDTLVKDVDAITVNWKYGNRIAFEYLDSGETKLALINSDGTGQMNMLTSSVTDPQISCVNPNHIYGKRDYGYIRLNVTNYPTIESTTFIASLEAADPQLSPDAAKIVIAKTDGIYTILLSTGAETKIKP